jgi:DNA-binding transcriptional ArsR family regulator
MSGMLPGPGADGQSLARLASLLADATRAGMCLALLDGRAWTAGELAKLAGVAPSTASVHLTQLVAGGLLTEEHQGRHRYVRIASPAVAEMIEDLAGRAAPGATAARSLRAVSAATAMARGRICYDHLAGRLGVRLLDAMAARGLLEVGNGVAVTAEGLRWLGGLGIDVGSLRASRRLLARDCMDRTERRPHLAGAAGAGLCGHFFEAGWIERIGRHRAVRVTDAGHVALEDLLGISPSDLELTAPAGGPGARSPDRWT